MKADRADAMKDVNVEGLCAWANNAKFWIKPPSGRFETSEDLEGMLIAGDPDDVVRECRKFENAGTAIAAIEESVPAPVLLTALASRFTSRGLDHFADQTLSAMRK